MMRGALLLTCWFAVVRGDAKLNKKFKQIEERGNRVGGKDGENATEYHYFPHNQHLFLLPECASQQVCNAVYLRLNYSTPLCACPESEDPCSASTLATDGHSLSLTATHQDKVLTLAKTCERTDVIRPCSKTRDWSILALQNIRTGKAHYLVICKCPDGGFLEGPVAQTAAPYAKVPGIRVYGMLCVKNRLRRKGRSIEERLRRKSQAIDGQNSHVPPLPAFPQVPQSLVDRVAQ